MKKHTVKNQQRKYLKALFFAFFLSFSLSPPISLFYIFNLISYCFLSIDYILLFSLIFICIFFYSLENKCLSPFVFVITLMNAYKYNISKTLMYFFRLQTGFFYEQKENTNACHYKLKNIWSTNYYKKKTFQNIIPTKCEV